MHKEMEILYHRTPFSGAKDTHELKRNQDKCGKAQLTCSHLLEIRLVV